MAISRAVESFAYTDGDGIPRIVRAGDLVSSDDPGVKGREHLFESVEDSVSRSKRSRAGAVNTETASAAPGERRARTKVSKEDAGE